VLAISVAERPYRRRVRASNASLQAEIFVRDNFVWVTVDTFELGNCLKVDGIRRVVFLPKELLGLNIVIAVALLP
jgi:hypothetical protein